MKVTCPGCLRRWAPSSKYEKCPGCGMLGNRDNQLSRVSVVGQTAITADFFAAEEGRRPVVLVAPTARDAGGRLSIFASSDDMPNPLNPGGVSNNALKAQNAKAASVAAQKLLDASKKAADAADVRKMANDQAAALSAARSRAGGTLGDLAVIGKEVGTVAAIAAATIATGGAAAGVLGVAGAATLASAAVTAQQISNAINTGSKAVSAASKGDVKGTLVNTASTLQTAGVGDAHLALPGLAAKAPEVVAAVKVTADRVLAAGEAGVQKAADVYHATKALAQQGNKDAIAAVSILADVAKTRASVAVAGQPQPLNAAGAAALASFPVLAAKASTAPSSPPVLSATEAAARDAAAKAYDQEQAAKRRADQAMSGALAASAALAASSKPAVAGVFVYQDGPNAGRLNFSAQAWRPVAPSTPGALHGLVVSTAGRIAFDTDWVPA